MKLSDKTLRFLRDHKLDPEGKPEDRSPAVHVAVLEKRPMVVQDLINVYTKDCLNAKAQKAPRKGRSPLQNAAQRGLGQIVAMLLAKGANVDQRTRGRWTALILAAEAGQSDMVQVLVKHGADVNARTKVENTDTKGYTALHVAARRPSPDTILKLLLLQADPKLTTAEGDTPLHFAMSARCIAPAALLLFHGASPTAKNNNGVTPRDLLNKLSGQERRSFGHVFDCATSGGETHNLLINDYLKADAPLDMATAIHWAVGRNLDRAVAYLLHVDSHAVEAQNPRGWHPLHRVANMACNTTMRVLIEHGANINCVTKTGWTPLMLAAEKGHVETLRILIDHNADQKMCNDDKNTALQIAKHCGQRLPTLLLSFRHVPQPAEETVSGKRNSGDALLPPAGKRSSARTPSPGPGERRELEGELFALSDATMGEASSPSPENPQYIEAFLNTLERTWYNQVQWSPEDDVASAYTQSWTGPVKIAILDTGIDLDHDDFLQAARRRTKIGQKAASQLPEKPQRDRIKACRSFIGKDANNVMDVSGHGTHLAGLIMAVAPRAELYIARTSTGLEQPAPEEDTKPTSKKGRRESRRPVEEALRWAIDQNVDIINLSLGFPRESSYELTRTLEEADHKGIIVFAAAANHGDREAIAWPARDPDLSICVTSGNEFNTPSDFAPRASKGLSVFITHGENISSHWPTKLGGGFRKMSGTSVSTPLAVGMAAMILAFLNKTNAWSPTEKRRWLDRSKERRLRSTRGMGRLLEHICRDRNGLQVLSPRLMWEEDSTLEPLQVLSLLAHAFKLPG